MASLAHFSFREQLRELKRGRPGQRFQERYRHAHRKDNRCGAGQRIVMAMAAVVCLAIGAVLAVFPGPAIPFFFLSGALLASESRLIARLMDWIEVKARAVAAWAKRRWRRLPGPARVILIMVGVCCSAGATYLGYRLLKG
jgi:hypothetical protein